LVDDGHLEEEIAGLLDIPVKTAATIIKQAHTQASGPMPGGKNPYHSGVKPSGQIEINVADNTLERRPRVVGVGSNDPRSGGRYVERAGGEWLTENDLAQGVVAPSGSGVAGGESYRDDGITWEDGPGKG
jgi:hypothetical protein